MSCLLACPLPSLPLQAIAISSSCQLAHTDLHTEPGGYLREVLTAKVYDVAVTTPLQRAEKLRWGCLLLLVRAAAASGAGMQACCQKRWGCAAFRSKFWCGLTCRRMCSDATGSTILLKREDLQPVKSFKLRGAYNSMARLTAEQLERGVICCSAGNHAQGVALAARHLVSVPSSVELRTVHLHCT